MELQLAVLRLLLVEDDVRAAIVLAKGLREQTYAVDVAGTGEEASFMASVNDYDAIILDVMLPQKDGFQLCAELRAAGANVPILMLTALDSLDQRVKGLDAGADDYLIKPFHYRELLARLRSLLRRGSTKQLGMRKVADLEVDFQSRRVTRGGQIIELTAK